MSKDIFQYLIAIIVIPLTGILLNRIWSIDISLITSIGISIFLMIISLKLTVSIKDLKNLLLIDIYTKEQASPEGKKFLLTQVFLKPKKHFQLTMYLSLETFLLLLFISKQKRKRILKEAEQQNLIPEFGAEYMNRIIKK